MAVSGECGLRRAGRPSYEKSYESVPECWNDADVQNPKVSHHRTGKRNTFWSQETWEGSGLQPGTQKTPDFQKNRAPPSAEESRKQKTENRKQKTENKEGELLGATKSGVVEVEIRMAAAAKRTTNAR
jgi:hypothetical protein